MNEVIIELSSALSTAASAAWPILRIGVSQDAAELQTL